MSFSTGTRSLMLEVASWFAAACLLATALANYDELKSYANNALGVPNAGDLQMPRQAAHRRSNVNSYHPDSVALTAGQHGHFITDADVNGRAIEVMVDTGASMVALTYEDAERAGIFLNDSDFTHRVNTANGVARVAPVTLHSVSIGSIEVRDVRAAVSEPGNLQTTLLGMSFLSRLDRVDMRSGELILEN